LFKALKICTDLVIEIEKTLPSDLKISFWWNSLEHLNYEENKRGNFIKRTDIKGPSSLIIIYIKMDSGEL
jgi:hypothetical protein